MTTEQAWLVAASAAAIALALVALLLAARAQRRTARAERLAASLAERVSVLEAAAAHAPAAATDRAQAPSDAFVITRVDAAAAHDAAGLVARDIDGRLFADIVARETVVKAASWTHGLRRALSAQTRNRIRFAVRQGTRQAGRERRAEMKEALRAHRARADVREDVA